MKFSRRQFLTHFGAASLANWVLFHHLFGTDISAQLALGTDTSKSPLPPDADEIAKRVRQEFLHAWNGYKQYAWGHDELRPLSKTYRDWHTVPLYMTPVDSLDTMIIMGLQEEAKSTREFIAKHLTFNCDISVKNFEITIRMLGGLLSRFLLSGDNRLLELSEDMGSRLLPVFNSPTGMPYVYVNLKTGAVRDERTNPAEVATLLLEFGTLAKLTGKPIYYDKAKQAMVELFKRRSSIGLVGSGIDVKTGEWTDTTRHVGGGIDSYYEYLLKSWLLFGDKDCEQMWRASIEAANKYVADEQSSGLWYGEVDMNTGKRKGTDFGSLDAFLAGTLALSGDLDRARRLQNSSYKMWTLYGIEPEELDYSRMKVAYDGYALRSEIIESAYYLNSFTHDSRYREMGQTFLDSLAKYCRTDVAYAVLQNVETRKQSNAMETFFLAETLKYLYLLFAPAKALDLEKFVFNTEAHPIRKDFTVQSSRASSDLRPALFNVKTTLH